MQRNWLKLLLFFIVIAALWLPRGVALDRFVTIDENRWLTRSANFHRAIVHGEYAYTYQHGHPGVTIMWLGMAGYLWRYPTYAADAPGEFGWENSEFEQYLRTQEYDALDLLEAGRIFAVLASVVALSLAYLVARRLFGLGIATLGFLLIAFDPFEVALTRFLHLDGLLSSWMLLALLLYLAFLYRGRRWWDLIGSGLALGLAWLTKTPSFFLMPIIGVLAIIELWRYQRQNRRQTHNGVEFHWFALFWRRAVAPALLWALIGAVLYIVLWPAMWVDPLGTLQKVFAVSSEYATEGHSNPLFFRGDIINGDPGWWFYPWTWLWRVTPVVLVGLLLGLVALVVRGWRGARNGVSEIDPDADNTMPWIVWSLLIFALLFLLLMNVSAKKLDRYLVPIYPASALVAAYGFGVVGRWIGERWQMRWSLHTLAGVGMGVIILAQVALLAPTYPYYMSYYNPLLGGADAAAQQLTLGWGEGLDQAARYLRESEDEMETRVAAWYRTGPFDYFYHGTVVSPQYFWFADYIVTYVNQWQRQMPARQIMAYLEWLQPEKTIAINGTDYAHIYDLREAPQPAFVADWGEAIRLVSYTMPTGNIQRGETFDIVLQLVNLAPIETNLNLLLRVVNQGTDGDTYEIARYEWRPAGIATVDWKKDELWHHRTTVEVAADAPPGLYRVEVSFFDPETQVKLPAVQRRSGQPIGDTLVLDYLVLERVDAAVAHGAIDEGAAAITRLDPPANLDNKVTLLGTAVTHADGVSLADRPLHAGDELLVNVYWRTTGLMDIDYTAFGHLVGPEGQLATQVDHLPLDGFVPTSLWYPSQIFVDRYRLTIPSTAAPGAYPLHMGMYDLATVTRLPITRNGGFVGDSVVAVVLEIEE